jgi:acetoin utilization deacetylase AcuC-like enzyme
VLPFHLIYHDGYDLNLGDHVFPSQKYRMIRERLEREGFAAPEDFLMPEPATEEQLLLVHDPVWVAKLRDGRLSYEDIIRLEIPYSRKMVEAFFLAAGGSILAGRKALQEGVGYNIGGGFHHAFPGHGEGFCAIHDVAVAIRTLQKEGLIRRALVVDCDVHQGNGTAAIFAGDPTVSTISIHQHNNYPAVKPPSTIDIHLPDGVGDQEYLTRLREAYGIAVPGFQPDIVYYVAGADPYMQDQLGGLMLTLEGLKERDRTVLEIPLRLGIPVVITLAGGYAVDVNDTVTIHCQTAYAAKEVIEDCGWKRRRTGEQPATA